MKNKLLLLLIFPLSLLAQDDSLSIDDGLLRRIDSTFNESSYFDFLEFDQEALLDSFDCDIIFEETSTYIKRTQTLDSISPFNVNYNEAVAAYIKVYLTRNKKLTSKILGLMPYYEPIFEETLDRYNLPFELKYLPIIESALNPNARSRAGATGLWQFMYRTGRYMGLEINNHIDERKDVYKSTDAAARYLKKLHKMYGNWELALAAYNCGPGNVNKAIRRSGESKDYWKIRPFLPRETRGYVPAFLGVLYCIEYAKEHGIQPLKPNFLRLKTDTVMVKEFISFNLLSKHLEMDIEEISFFNPLYKQDYIPKNKTGMPLQLPISKMGKYIELEKAIIDQGKNSQKNSELTTAIKHEKKKIYTKNKPTQYYTVRNGDFLGKIANKHHCTVSDIKRWNNLSSTRLKIGQKLKIYSSHTPSTKKSIPSKQENKENYVYYTIKPGDNLWDIANKLKDVSVEDLKRWNNGVSFKRLKPGMKIKIKKA